MGSEKSTGVPTKSLAKAAPEETIIASSFCIEGDLLAEGYTRIEGQVEGSIRVEDHTVHIGKKGCVKGEIFAKEIIAEGRVKGRITAKEMVVLRQPADVQGDILAPRVLMEEGCKFNGNVKMDAAAPSTSADSH
jgi:cytoskeletal protein CcmA (bactofilin family)